MRLRITYLVAGAAVGAIAACGGAVKDVAPKPESSTLGGASGVGEGGAPSSDSSQGAPEPAASGTVGARRAAGGALSMSTRGTGGTKSSGAGGTFPCDVDFTSATGGATWIEVPGERPGDCGYILNPGIWTSMCPAESGCLHLDPSSSVSEPADAATPAGMPVVELPLCEPPLPGRTYMFAFDADPAEQQGGFDAYTGSCACAGYSLGYVGFDEPGGAPPDGKRTYCFRVDGRYLQDRLSVVSYSGGVSNLRSVSSCPCSVKMPSNYADCPTSPPAAGGAPTCD